MIFVVFSGATKKAEIMGARQQVSLQLQLVGFLFLFFVFKYQLQQASALKDVNLWSVDYFQMLQVTGKCVWKRVER